MTRSKKLLALLLALVVVSAAAFAATKLNVEEDVEEEDVIFSAASEDVTALSWTYDGETSSFTKTDDEWTYDEDSSFPVNESRLTTMVEALAEITASKTIDEPSDLSEYGLDEPSCSVTVTAGDTATTLEMGDSTSMDGAMYLSLGDGKVYLVDSSLLTSFSYGLYDLVANESIPDMEDITSVSVQTVSGTLELEYLENSGLAYSDDYVWFQSTDDGYVTLDTELTDDFVSAITDLSWSECVNYHADDAALEEYGLDEPTATVTVHYVSSTENEDGETEQQNETFALDLGEYTGDGCYARLTGSNMVYLIDGTTVDTLLYTTAQSLLPDDVLKLELDTVNSVDITLGSTSYTVQRTVTEVTEEDDDGESTTTEEVVWTLADGTEVTPAAALSQITGLTASSSDDSLTPGLSAAMSFTFHRNTDTYQTIELIFYQYDSSSYLVSLNGETRLLVDRDSVDEIKDALETALEPDEESATEDTTEDTTTDSGAE